jgi:hypothetical protein
MSIDSIRTTSISAFPVSPSVTIPAQLLQDLLETVQSLKDEVQDLKETIAAQDAKIKDLDAQQLKDVDRLALDIAYDRQRIAALEHKDPGPTDEDRCEKLKAYLTTKKDAGQRPEISFTEARTYLEVSRSQFSQLISKLDPRDFVISAHPLNYKAKMIGLARKM